MYIIIPVYLSRNKQKQAIMKNYSILTNDELIKELEMLEEAERQDNLMDGSGDCGSLISEHYAPYYNAIQDELNERGVQIDEVYEDDMPY